MSFLRKLFGGEDRKSSSAKSSDPTGIYLYVECDRCHSIVKLRADKEHELNNAPGGYVWHKTVVDSKCFQRIPTVVHFDRSYTVTSTEISGGHFVGAEDYQAWLEASQKPAPQPDDRVEDET